jgi:hypothetical protein
MDIPSLFMIPSAVSSGKVHSVFPNSTDADFDFNRDSDATRVNSEGLIERVGYYGSEKITNGDFAQSGTPDTSTYTLGWYSNTGGVNISNGSLTLTNGSSDTDIRAYATNGVFSLNILTTNIDYKLEFDIVSNQGSTDFEYYSAAGAFIDAPLTVGRHTINIKNTSNQLFLFRNKTPNSSITLDNVSIKQINGDRARLNYEIEGGLVNTKPSLLLEPQSTNIFLNSNNLSQWLIGAGLTVTTNLVTSPDGTKNADQIKKTSENYTYIRQSLTTGSVSVFSIFVKQGNYRYIGIRNNDSGHSVFDFETKTFVTSKADHNLSFKELPNGWFRLIDKRTISTNTSAFRGVALTLADGTELHSHIPLNAFAYVWGGQLENAATYSTSLIPTNGSTQTRAAETCNGAGTSSILPSEEGILYVETASLSNSGNYRLICLSDGTTSNRVFIGFRLDTGYIYYFVIVGGSMKLLHILHQQHL